MSKQFTLVIPGLRPSKQFVAELGRLEAKEIPSLTNLDLLLSRADMIPADDVVHNDYLLEQLSPEGPCSEHWPLAKWRLAHDLPGLETGAPYWLCADPVYIHPDRSDLLLLAHEELSISLEESQQLAKLINQHYHDEPWQLHVATTHRWYIGCKKQYQLSTSPLSFAQGKNIFDYLPSGEDAVYWQQCLNEIQMLLHASEVNQAREASGLMPINSLWLWGYASGVDDLAFQWQKVYTHDAVLKGMAVVAGGRAADMPDDMDEILTGFDDVEGDVLLYNRRLVSPLQQNDIFSWLDEVEYLEQYWFAPLLKRLRTQPDLELNLLMDNKHAYRLSAKQLKRWWRLTRKNSLFKV